MMQIIKNVKTNLDLTFKYFTFTFLIFFIILKLLSENHSVSKSTEASNFLNIS